MSSSSSEQLEIERPKLMVEGSVPPKLRRDFTIIGRSFNRIDALEKVTGKAKYAGDFKSQGTLYAKILRSPYAHARIVSIDTTKAQKLPGVKAILTKDNPQGWLTQWYDVPQPAFPEIVSYVGHEIAAVAAESIDIARKACDLINVVYEPLPAVFDAEEALKPEAPHVTVSDIAARDLLGSSAPSRVGNVWGGKPTMYERGDVERGFKEADFVLERRYKTPFQHHGTLQTRSCVAYWDSDILTLQESCQGVWPTKRNLAKSLEVPVDKIRVLVKFQGGGFGSKAGAHRSITYAAKLSMMTSRPVRLELTRAEEFISHPRRPSTTVYIKTGVKRDGTLTAIMCKAIINIGSGGLYSVFAYDFIQHAMLLYDCPNMHLEQIGVYTNLQYTGPERSPLNVAAASSFEAHMDEVAGSINMDPLEFRRKNYTTYSDPIRKTPFSAKNLDLAMDQVARAIGWHRRLPFSLAEGQRRKKRGIGMGIYVFHGVGLPPFEAKARVTIDRNGAIKLYAGVVDIGTGCATTLSMIAAEELGVSLENIDIIYGDTEETPYAPGTHASRIIPEMGPAVLQASSKAREELFQRVAACFKVERSALESSNRWIYLKDNPKTRISFAEACRRFVESDTQIIGTGSRAPNVGTAPYNLLSREASVTHATFGATAVEVEVDEETGEISVIRSATAHEFGRALNPKLCNSQHYGGLVFGIGYGLLEEAILDSKTGIMLNTDLHQYRIPTSLDMPEEAIPLNIEGEDEYFAYSSKGGGEGINSAVAAAIRNAVANATGVWFNEYPLTPARVIDGLKSSQFERKAYA